MLNRVNGDEGLRTSAEKHSAVLFNQILPVSMMRREVKISRLHQIIANAAHHLGVVSVAKLRHQYSDGARPLCSCEALRFESLKLNRLVRFFHNGHD